MNIGSVIYHLVGMGSMAIVLVIGAISFIKNRKNDLTG